MTATVQDPDHAPEWTSTFVQSFRSGDAAAIDTVYRRYREQLFRIMERRCARSEHRILADDVVQETFIRAFGERARASFDGCRPFLPFLVGIGIRVLADAVRADRRAQAPALDQSTESLEGTDVDWDVLAVRRVRAYVACLPPELLSVYRERFENDGSQRGAAKRLGLSHQQIRTLERRLVGDCHGAVSA
jgi:RNA polymerase sigma factor (sigma-70 family)